MNLEVEHKFLVQRSSLPRLLPRGQHLVQGYLSLSPVVRVRIIERKKAFLTIKGKGLRARAEFEYRIPVSDARELLKLCGSHVLEKIRRRIGAWEVDEFLGRHRPLWLAEIELKTRHARLPQLPEWTGAEVTGDKRYSNAALAALGRPSTASAKARRAK